MHQSAVLMADQLLLLLTLHTFLVAVVVKMLNAVVISVC